MNILPKKFSDFKEKTYWNHFFKSLKSTDQQYFEWYGSYEDFKSLLPKIINNKHRSIFNVGCGKSTFAEDFKKDYSKMEIVSCDYSEDVINDMLKKTKQIGSNLQYVSCDMLKQLQQKWIQKFDIVFDKGTLDAILPEDQLTNQQKITKIYFSNVQKCLVKTSENNNPKYLVVSMLQPHVLKTLITYFIQRPCNVFIYECIIKDSQMQPFLISIEFLQQSSNLFVLQRLNGTKTQFAKQQIQQLYKEIRHIQISIQYGDRVKRLVPGQRLQYNVFDKQQQIRYTLQILDNCKQNALQKNTCAVFVAPQGKQNSFLYGSQQGLKMLHDQIASSRVIVAKLMIGSKFESLQQVKKELNEVIPNLIQKDVNVKNVPYLTDGDQLGQRQYLYQDNQIIIQQVMIDEEPFRRLVLRDALSLTQTQFRLTYCSANNNPQLKDLQTNILPKKKNLFVCIDKQYLEKGCFQFMASGIIGLINSKKLNNQGCRILFLGGGGCCVPKFLFDYYDALEIVIVQLDKSIVKIAKKYFQLPQSENFKIILGDAHQYIIKLKQDQKFDAIVLDVNGGQGQPTPPQPFKSEQFINKLSKHLQVDDGLFIMHMIRNKIPNSLFQNFTKIYSVEQQQDFVEVLYCLNKQIPILKIDGQERAVLTKGDIHLKNKNKTQFQWVNQIISKTKLIHPKQGGQHRGVKTFLDQESKYIKEEESDIKNKKKKKGKK